MVGVAHREEGTRGVADREERTRGVADREAGIISPFFTSKLSTGLCLYTIGREQTDRGFGWWVGLDCAWQCNIY